MLRLSRLPKWGLVRNRKLIIVLLSIIIVVVAGSVSFAEERNPNDVIIELYQGRLKINGLAVSMPSEVEKWVEALGPYTRVRDLGRSSYIWDNFGIRTLTDATGKIDDFIIDFKRIPEMEAMRKRTPVSERSEPEKCFFGSFILNGVELNATMPLWEYNYKLKDNRFYEDYIPVVYKIPGGKISETNHSFGVSARVGPDLRVYLVEVHYTPKDCSSPLEDGEDTQPDRFEGLKSELKNAADSVKRRLGITSKPDAPKTGEENK